MCKTRTPADASYGLRVMTNVFQKKYGLSANSTDEAYAFIVHTAHREAIEAQRDAENGAKKNKKLFLIYFYIEHGHTSTFVLWILCIISYQSESIFAAIYSLEYELHRDDSFIFGPGLLYRGDPLV
jgi:hypothetical protein